MRTSTFVIAGAALIVGVLFASALRAQAPSSVDASGPAFEAASVKPNNSGDVGSLGMHAEGVEFRATNVTVRMLVSQAYDIRQEVQLAGGPAWIDHDRFDIAARMGRPGSPFPMVRTLLADRFKLAVHHETRELPIYALLLARNDGRLGPKLQPSTCVAGRRPPGDATAQPCGFRPGPGIFVSGGVPIAMLATFVSSAVRRSVVDRTGLDGNFDIDLHWLPDNSPLGPQPDTPPPDPGGPSIFTALQEQLGLKLESTRGPVDVLVIDHVEQPTPD